MYSQSVHESLKVLSEKAYFIGLSLLVIHDDFNLLNLRLTTTPSYTDVWERSKYGFPKELNQLDISAFPRL